MGREEPFLHRSGAKSGRGVTSGRNVAEMKALKWETIGAGGAKVLATGAVEGLAPALCGSRALKGEALRPDGKS